ncbi:hypothetical protein [Lewinella sp. IMCC34183]|uniref:hypothetical protein n=1 Tax=Lewinella sp. IMCC34183 TaxID=2248762 RepID=UPI0013004E27|nr:hypothetical protein [Lewinella sp. IMCC34183]
MRPTRPLLFLTVTAGLGLGLLRCSGESEPGQGVVTTVREVAPTEFRIADERPVDQISDSRVIVDRMSGDRDTFTLAEVKAIEQTEPDSSRVRRPFHSAGLGYWGFIMLNRMGRTPAASAYTNQAAYQRATGTAGSSLSRTSRARSGFGRSSGTSTRSFGG